MDDLLQEFIAETIESLAEIDQQLLELEATPENEDLIRSIFRTLHTIKGTCGFLGLTRMEGVAHASETLLGKMRDRKLSFTPTIGTALFEALDRLKDIVEAVELNQNYTDPTPDQDLVNLLLALSEEAAESPPEAPAEEVIESEFVENFEPQESPEDVSSKETSPASEAPQKDISSSAEKILGDEVPIDQLDDLFADINTPHKEKAAQDASQDASQGDEPEATQDPSQEESKAADEGDSSQAEPLNEAPAVTPTETASSPPQDSPKSPEPPSPPTNQAPSTDGKNLAQSPKSVEIEPVKPQTKAPQRPATDANQSIRVGLNVLDNLINLVSELVLTRNQLVQLFQAEKQNQIVDTALSRLSYITAELQDEVMKTRMQPIDSAWIKFPRMLRDLTRDSSKKINLVQEGGSTEVDRQVLELIKDPLTHMIRNSADHGIETPDVRKESGKPEEGTIKIKAYHEGGHIIMEMSDDGHGLDSQKLKSKAIEKGLFTPLEAGSMSERQLQSVIFMPGFSTAAAVTNVSGRGVGMDVVRSNIEKLGGSIDLSSTLGKGTNFTVKIPLTLTIISAVILEVRGERVAVPQISITELHRIGSRSTKRIEFVKDTAVLRLRDELIPIIDLAQEIGMPPIIDKDNTADTYVVITRIGATQFGIVVDKIFDTQEIVVKPLSKMIGDIKLFSGSTILGDGSIVLIIDPNTLASKITDNRNADLNAANNQIVKKSKELDKTLLLIFDAHQKRYGIPLCLVSRITEYNIHNVERLENLYIIHYNDTLLPIVFLNGTPPALEPDALDENGDPHPGNFPMLVFSDRGRSMAIAIEEIISIEDLRLEIEFSAKTTGALGSTIVNDTTTLIIDIEYYIKSVFPNWFDDDSPNRSRMTEKPRLLFVEDSSFFKNLMIPLFSLSGFQIVMVDNGVEGLKVLEEDKNFNAVVTDIEMPEMDGYEFAQEIRKRSSLVHMPIIALSSKVSEEDVQHGIECGFTSHLSKTDQKVILEVLEQYKRKKDDGGADADA